MGNGRCIQARLRRLERVSRPVCGRCGGWPTSVVIEDLETGATDESMPQSGCPGCQRRRAVLFSAGGVFRCRGCHDLAYQSTREDETDRLGRRIRTLQRKLKAAPDCDIWHIPWKPEGMHWTTCSRLASELRSAIMRRDALFGARCEALLARSERLLSERGG